MHPERKQGKIRIASDQTGSVCDWKALVARLKPLLRSSFAWTRKVTKEERGTRQLRGR